jgi:hypothetical protein
MSLWSPVKEIQALRPIELSRRTVKIAPLRFVKVKDITILVFPDGKWWTNYGRIYRYAFPLGAQYGMDDLFEALLFAKLITPEQHKKHIAAVKREHDKASRRSDLRQLHNYAKKLGYTVKKKEAIK